MKKVRILHVITGLSTGGAERALYNVLAGGLAWRYEHTVISLRDAGNFGARIQRLGVPVHALGMRHGVAGPLASIRLQRATRAFKPDVIQGWMYHGNIAAWYGRAMAPGSAALAWNVRHSLYDLKFEKRLTRQVIRGNRVLSGAPDGIIYNSRVSREQHEAFGFTARRGCVIPNGVDLDAFRPDSGDGQKLRSRLGITPASVVIGHVARCHPMKDHARFLRVASRIAREREDVHVLLVGRDLTQANQALVSMVPREIEDRFHWLGESSDIASVMQGLDVLCLSSAWGEAFPNVLGEAMAVGVPCVTTDVGDSASLVGDSGLVVPPNDDEALEAALSSILARPAGQRRELGERARERIRNNFALGAVVDQYSEFYERLSRGRD